MSYLFLLFLCLVLVHKSTAFHVSGLGLSNSMNKFAKRTNSFTNLASTASSEVAGVGEEGIPEQLRNHKCLYDMILVERLTVPETTKSGLYVPRAGKKEQRVARVVAMPKGYGVESATGNVVPVEVLAPFKAGDLVFVKERWGQGPLDIEIEKRLFSFMRSVSVLGVVDETPTASNVDQE